MKKQWLVRSIAASSIVTICIILVRNIFNATMPLILFNLAGLFKIPGNIATQLLFFNILPDSGWQALHATKWYDAIGYLLDLIIYFAIFFIIIYFFQRVKDTDNK